MSLVLNGTTGISGTNALTGVTSVNSGQVSGRRNIVINGEMKVAQRSTSVTGLGAAAGYFTLDRFSIATAASAGRFTMAQIADGPAGIANCLKITTTTADTSIAAGEYLILGQPIEGQDLQQLKKGTASAKQVTVSFYVKGNAAALYVCELFDGNNGRSITQSFAVTTSWNRIELTFAADTSDPLNDDNAVSLYIIFWLHAGSNFTSGTFAVNTWADNVNANRAAVDDLTSIFDATSRTLSITGIQMEIGTQATDFESRSYGEELALCQRYCVAWTFSGSYSNIVAAMATASGTVAVGDLILPVTHRVKPTGIVYSGDAVTSITSGYGVGGAGTLVIGTYSNPHSLNLRLNSTSGLTAGHATKIACSGSGDLYTTGGEL